MKCEGHILFNAHLSTVDGLIDDNPDVAEVEGEEGSGEEVEEGGGEGEGEKKRKGKRKRRGLSVHLCPVLSSVCALLYRMLVNTCCVLRVVDDQLDEDDLELIKENTGVDIQVVGLHGLVSSICVCIHVHIHVCVGIEHCID